MKKEVRFEIPEVGSFKIGVNGFKHLAPFPHLDKKQKEEYKKEKDKMKEFTVWHNGCGIGRVDKIEDGYDVIKEYAEKHLKRRRCEHECTLERINEAIESTKVFDWIQLFRKEQ